MKQYADIILPLALHQSYTYSVPANIEPNLFVGARVIVPFGKSKLYTGVVLRLHNTAPEVETKAIEELLDTRALITEKQLQFWQWIGTYYMCSLGEVYKAALPSGLKLESETEITLCEGFNEDHLNEQERIVIDALKTVKSFTIDQINKVLHASISLSLIKQLLEKKCIEVNKAMKINYREKLMKFVALEPEHQVDINKTLSSLSKYALQETLLNTFLTLTEHNMQDCVLQQNLLEASQINASVLKTLVKKGVFKIIVQQVNRTPDTLHEIHQPHDLNPLQKDAIGKINDSFKTMNVCLLHGVTSSGKTEVYIHLIKEVLAQNKQVLFLVPEIALTPQMTSRLQRVFGRQLGVYHSKFSDAERVELWKKQADPEQAYNIILGVRSSVFLPYHKLGLIIVDEEHESSYKQYDPNPRYHARDLAIVLALQYSAKTLLGTATPSVETYFNALSGKYGLVEMNQRHHNVSMPEIQSVDMTQVYHRKDHISNFSAPLLHEIEEALNNKQQVILFQNRRGHSAYMECYRCGYVPKCKHCDVSLTYYQHAQRLTCHYCGYSISTQSACLKCNNTHLHLKGFGTEKIETELKELFLDARVQRMDLDTTRSKNAYEHIIRKFENHELDILVGTQMVSKGLDFAGVHVVGIMNADHMLNFPDFRSHERAYQLMAQVSGRAGRSKKKGIVILQTKNPNHSIVNYVIDNNYTAMYEEQIKERELFRYPPFYRLIKISFHHIKKAVLDQAMHAYSQNLKHQLGNRVLGPEWPVVSRIKNKYTKCLIVKIEKTAPIARIKDIILNEIQKIQQEKNWSGIRASIDVDPM